MAEVKALSVDAAAADFVVSNDPSCLLQLGGYFSRTGRRVKCLHIAEVLASR
jgi:L-lactate dehydrogenase complex protein LldE